MTTHPAYEMTKPTPDQLTFRLKGKIDADTMRVMLDEFFTLAEPMSDAKLLYIAEKAELPSIAAIGVEMTRLPKLLPVASNFTRCAVVASESWVKLASQVQGKLSPNLVMETFEPHEVSVAQTWLDAPQTV